MTDKRDQAQHDRDEKTAIPLDPEEALRGLLKVDPEAAPADKRIKDVTKGSVRGKPNT